MSYGKALQIDILIKQQLNLSSISLATSKTVEVIVAHERAFICSWHTSYLPSDDNAPHARGKTNAPSNDFISLSRS